MQKEKASANPLIYFAYGSNLHPLRLQERVPSSKPFAVATLEHYVLRFHKRGKDGSGKCNVYYTGQAGDHVIGVLYEMLPSEKYLLDQAEGLGIGYNEARITTKTNDGEIVAFCYVATSDHLDDQLPPYIWYKELVVHGARIHNLPNYYQDQIATVNAIPDPDPIRTRRHINILHRYESSL